MERRPLPDRHCHETTDWRPLPVRTVEIAKLQFGKERFSLDPTLFPECHELTPWLDSTKSIKEHSIAELTQAGCESMRVALHQIDNSCNPHTIEIILRSHLGGILKAFAEKDPIEAPRVIHGQYVAFRDKRFLDQALAVQGGAENFQKLTGFIADDFGLELVLYGEHGVEGAAARGNLYALQGLITLTEGLIERAYSIQRNHNPDQIVNQLEAEVEGLGDSVTKIERSPFAIIVYCSVGGQRALIEDHFEEKGATPLEKHPEIIVFDADYCPDGSEQDKIREGLSASVKGFFTRSLFRETPARGVPCYQSESEFVRWMLFGA